MKRLILMRHAKSDWSFNLADRDRPLNNRGKRSAPALADWLRDKGYIPDEAVVSDAIRTRETWALLGFDAPVRFREDLYLAQPEVMFDALTEAKADTVLMIGHNPGIAALAQDLVANPPDHHRFGDYPTCATLVAEFDIDDWTKTAPGTGWTLDFIVPRALV